MTKFRIICPNCGAGVITETPRALVWELCHGCKQYVWDMSDVLMAEALCAKTSKSEALIATTQ